MAIETGDRVTHPKTGQTGGVLETRTNPACHMRSLFVRWDDGTSEWLEEIEFGPLED